MGGWGGLSQVTSNPGKPPSACWPTCWSAPCAQVFVAQLGGVLSWEQEQQSAGAAVFRQAASSLRQSMRASAGGGPDNRPQSVLKRVTFLY